MVYQKEEKSPYRSLMFTVQK